MDLLGHFCVHLLETLFFFGILGSLGVVLISLVKDLQELSVADHPEAKDQIA